MRLLGWLVGLPLIILVIDFAVSNRQPITVGFWPFAEGIEAPGFVIALVPLAIGLILGAAFAGVGTLRARWRHRMAARRTRELERHVAELRARTPKIAAPSDKTKSPAPQP